MKLVLVIIMSYIFLQIFRLVEHKINCLFRYEESNSRLNRALLISFSIILFSWVASIWYLSEYGINLIYSTFTFEEIVFIRPLILIGFVSYLMYIHILFMLVPGKPVRVTAIYKNGEFQDKLNIFIDILPAKIEKGKPIIFKKDVRQISEVKNILYINDKEVIIKTEKSLYKIERI